MKGKFFILAFVLGAMNVFVAMSQQEKFDQGSLSLERVEQLSTREAYNPYCHNGGPGSSHCSIEGGVSIAGYGASAKCDVDCNSGYYACCGIRCTCKKE